MDLGIAIGSRLVGTSLNIGKESDEDDSAQDVPGQGGKKVARQPEAEGDRGSEEHHHENLNGGDHDVVELGEDDQCCHRPDDGEARTEANSGHVSMVMSQPAKMALMKAVQKGS